MPVTQALWRHRERLFCSSSSSLEGLQLPHTFLSAAINWQLQPTTILLGECCYTFVSWMHGSVTGELSCYTRLKMESLFLTAVFSFWQICQVKLKLTEKKKKNCIKITAMVATCINIFCCPPETDTTLLINYAPV